MGRIAEQGNLSGFQGVVLIILSDFVFFYLEQIRTGCRLGLIALHQVLLFLLDACPSSQLF